MAAVRRANMDKVTRIHKKLIMSRGSSSGDFRRNGETAAALRDPVSGWALKLRRDFQGFDGISVSCCGGQGRC